MKDAELSMTARILVEHLKHHHQGEERAASAEHLVEMHHLQNDRDLRDAVEYARVELLEPIISTFSEGYSWPLGREDDAYMHCVAQRREMGARYFRVAEAIEAGMERYWPTGPNRLFEVGG